jgi:hypothetical protein
MFWRNDIPFLAIITAEVVEELVNFISFVALVKEISWGSIRTEQVDRDKYHYINSLKKIKNKTREYKK